MAATAAETMRAETTETVERKGRRIRTTLGAIARAAEPLQRLAAKAMPLKQAYHVAKIARLVEAEMKIFTEKRLEVFKAIGDEKPGPFPGAPPEYHVPAERMPGFTAKIDELCAVETELAWGPADLSGLPLEISAEDLLALEGFVVVEVAEE